MPRSGFRAFLVVPALHTGASKKRIVFHSPQLRSADFSRPEKSANAFARLGKSTSRLPRRAELLPARPTLRSSSKSSEIALRSLVRFPVSWSPTARGATSSSSLSATHCDARARLRAAVPVVKVAAYAVPFHAQVFLLSATERARPAQHAMPSAESSAEPLARPSRRFLCRVLPGKR